MRALIREYDTVKEIYFECDWTPWTRNNLDREIEINGWTLIENYQPDEVMI